MTAASMLSVDVFVIFNIIIIHRIILSFVLKRDVIITAIQCFCDLEFLEWLCHDSFRDALSWFQYPCTYKEKQMEPVRMSVLCFSWQPLVPLAANKQLEQFANADVHWLMNTGHPTCSDGNISYHICQWHLNVLRTSKDGYFIMQPEHLTHTVLIKSVSNQPFS